MNFDNFTFRSHALGLIMTNPKGKSPKEKYDELCTKQSELLAKLNEAKEGTKTFANLNERAGKMQDEKDKLKEVLNFPYLSDTCKSYLTQVYVEEVFSRTKDIKSKYLEKGLLLEEDGITQLSLFLGKMLRKNSQRRYNEFINGECDIDPVELGYGVDIKCAWDIFSFNKTISSPLDKGRYWQAQGYMELWDIDRWDICPILLNTPEHLIIQEQKRELYEVTFKSMQDYEDACNEIRYKLTYDDIPVSQRVFCFTVQRDKASWEAIKQRVPECRNWLNNFGNNTQLTNIEDETE